MMPFIPLIVARPEVQMAIGEAVMHAKIEGKALALSAYSLQPLPIPNSSASP